MNCPHCGKDTSDRPATIRINDGIKTEVVVVPKGKSLGLAILERLLRPAPVRPENGDPVIGPITEAHDPGFYSL